MTSSSKLFESYSPLYCNEQIRIADGSFNSISGKGTIKLSPHLTLQSVLHVPKLACNLLSVSKISRDSNCRVIFYDSHCVFQEQESGKTIGRARMLDGLYYFEEASTSHKKVQGLSSVSSPSVRETLMLWHYRLGHPSFFYLKYLFPELFKGIDCSTFHCEHCAFATFPNYLLNFKTRKFSAQIKKIIIRKQIRISL